jgi:hypothetical protein
MQEYISLLDMNRLYWLGSTKNEFWRKKGPHEAFMKA